MHTEQIGILGSGQVARALAEGFLKNGYKVRLGTRDAAKLLDWTKQAAPAGSVGSFREAAGFADIVVLAVKGSAAADVLQMAGTENLEGKIIIDVTNPIDDRAPENGVLHFFTSLEESLMEKLQRTVPDARFVKAFNSVGSSLMIDPDLPGGKPTMFICGDNAQAKKRTADIAAEFGWEAEDMGTSASARAIEPLCILWCIPGLSANSWTHAFKLLKK